jgi:hypothetical protein
MHVWLCMYIYIYIYILSSSGPCTFFCCIQGLEGDVMEHARAIFDDMGVPETEKLSKLQMSKVTDRLNEFKDNISRTGANGSPPPPNPSVPHIAHTHT